MAESSMGFSRLFNKTIFMATLSGRFLTPGTAFLFSIDGRMP
jgi:hypothetical protein